jgi:ribosomal-protein-serine acetyltransferase
MDRAEEGKGIISAACRVLIGYAFDELHLNRAEIRCATSNLRSAAIPERLGFRKEGVLRQSEFRDGQLHDFSIYGLLAEEWPNRS